MATALQFRPHDAPAVFGSREEIKNIANRMKAMLPSANLQDWQMAEKYHDEAVRNLNESLFKAAQLCIFYSLVPGVDVHLIPRGNKWAVDLGIETWRQAADRYCGLHEITYHIHFEDMPADMLRERRGDRYTPQDVGAIAYLWRSDKQQVYELFGLRAMTTGHGVWAERAEWNDFKKTWTPDTIPNQRSKEHVAERRAAKMALKGEFSLDSLLARDPREQLENQEKLEARIEAAERDQALPAARADNVQVEEDGEILFAM